MEKSVTKFFVKEKETVSKLVADNATSFEDNVKYNLEKDYPEKEKLKKVFREQQHIAKQMKGNLLSISSRYDMSILFPDAEYVLLAQKSFLNLFKPLEIFNNKDQSSLKFNKIINKMKNLTR